MDNPENNHLPPKLNAALRSLYTPARFTGNDAAILAAARAAGARRPGGWKWAVGMGIAAAVAVAATLFLVRTPDAGRGAHESAYARTGDIRDAFYIARQLKAHHAVAGSWDANGDGVIDEKDVQVLAAAAVRIDKGDVQ